MKPRRLLPWLLVGLFLWAGWAFWASEAGPPLTLGEAVLLALKENPGLKAAGLSLPAAEAQVARAGPGFSPRSAFSRPTALPTIPPRCSPIN
jgi:hypothetical protein